jgi:hypothetical protein
MAEIAQAAEDEVGKTAAESATKWLQASINIIVECDHNDLKLRFSNHLIMGGFVNQAPDQNVGYVDKINVEYISNVFRKGFEGVLICQIQLNGSEFPGNTFIMVGWDAPLVGSARIYAVLVETERDKVKWDMKFMKDQHKSFRGWLKSYTRPVETSWFLRNNIDIKLIIERENDRNYHLKIAIHENRPRDRDNLPIRIISQR